ncbi:MAG: hypothetical protein D6702_12255 [Planctomycetota bacterium]|nr:MAG: hypothetical protein D6702_12255 [Planctomycetota bacterium]
MIPAAAVLLVPAAQAAAPVSAPPSAERLVLAVTRSGRRVQAAAEPPAGALEVPTPWGVYSTPTDPVAVRLRVRPRRDWLDPAYAAPGRNSLQLVEDLAADGRIGDLLALAEHAAAAWTGPADARRRLAVVEALEAWGARLRQVPSEVAYEDRPEWLWRRILQEQGPRIHLLTGALVAELPRYSDTSTARRLPYSDLADGLESRRPEIRRAAALATARQNDGDRLRLVLLLERSLHDPDPIARDGFGAASAAYWSEAADAWWFSAVTRARDGDRIAAAEQLAAHGGERAVDYLVFGLSAFGQRAGRRFELAGKEVQVVTDTSDPGTFLLAAGPGGEGNNGVPYAITPDTDRFEHTSVVKVSKLRPAVTEALVRALARATGEGEERTAAEWLAWYRTRHPGRP